VANPKKLLTSVKLHGDKLPSGTYSKLKARNYGPYKVVQKINDNTYLIDLPESFSISKTFNISDIRKYYQTSEPENQLGTIEAKEKVHDATSLIENSNNQISSNTEFTEDNQPITGVQDN